MDSTQWRIHNTQQGIKQGKKNKDHSIQIQTRTMFLIVYVYNVCVCMFGQTLSCIWEEEHQTGVCASKGSLS